MISAVLVIGMSQAFAQAASSENIDSLRQKAEGGDVAAQTDLGYRYEVGMAGAPKDEAQAFYWFHKAAKLGSDQARAEMRKRYYRGQFVPEPDDQGGEWWQKFVAQAQDEMSGFSKDKASAEQGDKAAQLDLGLRYLMGIGIVHDRGQATVWIRRAAEGVNSRAQCYSALIAGYDSFWSVAGSGTQAIEICRKDAWQGHADTQLLLGHLLSGGRGILPVNVAEAATWYRKAAEQGRADAQVDVGIAYENGAGVPKDLSQALSWYRKAAEQGNETGLQYSLRLRMVTNGDRADDPKNLNAMIAEHVFDGERGLFLNVSTPDHPFVTQRHMVQAKTTSPQFPTGTCPFAEYPRDARDNKEEGSVGIALLVNPDGSVQSAEIESSSGHESLDQASLKAFRECHFQAGETKATAPVLIHQKWTWKIN
jgi:TonB family protein